MFIRLAKIFNLINRGNLQQKRDSKGFKSLWQGFGDGVPNLFFSLFIFFDRLTAPFFCTVLFFYSQLYRLFVKSMI